MVYSCSVGMQALGSPGRYGPRSATTCVLTRATQHKLLSDLQLALLVLGLEVPKQVQAVK